MKLWVGVTDEGWFNYMKARNPDEVNFWRPGGGGFKAVSEGAPFLFKLHSPNNYIVGGGFFVRCPILPLSIAWKAFGHKNGSANFQTFRSQILKYRERHDTVTTDPKIGCIILTDPFFLAEEDWIPAPSNWKPGIVQGKTYDDQESIGQELWAQVQQLLYQYLPVIRDDKDALDQTAKTTDRYGAVYLARPRLGQSSFRALVTEAYTYRCAITGERTLPVLEASHIKPYSESGPHQVDNGLLLRADLHILFDQGYLTVTDDYRVEVSRHIKEEFDNGRDYYALHGKELAILPNADNERPSGEFINWHNQQVYLP